MANNGKFASNSFVPNGLQMNTSFDSLAVWEGDTLNASIFGMLQRQKTSTKNVRFCLAFVKKGGRLWAIKCPKEDIQTCKWTLSLTLLLPRLQCWLSIVHHLLQILLTTKLISIWRKSQDIDQFKRYVVAVTVDNGQQNRQQQWHGSKISRERERELWNPRATPKNYGNIIANRSTFGLSLFGSIYIYSRQNPNEHNLQPSEFLLSISHAIFAGAFISLLQMSSESLWFLLPLYLRAHFIVACNRSEKNRANEQTSAAIDVEAVATTKYTNRIQWAANIIELSGKKNEKRLCRMKSQWLLFAKCLRFDDCSTMNSCFFFERERKGKESGMRGRWMTERKRDEWMWACSLDKSNDIWKRRKSRWKIIIAI